MEIPKKVSIFDFLEPEEQMLYDYHLQDKVRIDRLQKEYGNRKRIKP